MAEYKESQRDRDGGCHGCGTVAVKTGCQQTCSFAQSVGSLLVRASSCWDSNLRSNFNQTVKLRSNGVVVTPPAPSE